MPEIVRTRDVIILVPGDTYPVALDTALQTAGWQGGQGVQWMDSPLDEFRVGGSDGLFGGFLLWGSNESSDQFIASTGNQQLYRHAVMGAGGWIISTRTYERYTYASRTGGGALIPLVYTAGDRLRFSLQGWFTSEDEWSLSGDARAPNLGFIGRVTQAPAALTNSYLGVQTNL